MRCIYCSRVYFVSAGGRSRKYKKVENRYILIRPLFFWRITSATSVRLNQSNMAKHDTSKLVELITAWFGFGTLGPKTGKSDKPSIPPELVDAFNAECAACKCLSIVKAFYSMSKIDAEPSVIEHTARTLLGVLNDRLKLNTGYPKNIYMGCVDQTVQSEQTDLPSEFDVLNRLNNLLNVLRQLKVPSDIRQKFDMLFSLIEGKSVYAKWPATNFGSPNVGAIVARYRQCTNSVVLVRVTSRFVFGLTFEVVPLNKTRSAMHAELRRKMWPITLPDDLIRYIETGHNDGDLQDNLQKACKTGSFSMSGICETVMRFLNKAHPIDRPFSSEALELAYKQQPYNEAIGRLNEFALHYRLDIEEAKRIDGLLSAVASHTDVVTKFPNSASFLGYGPIKVVDQGFPLVGTVWYSTDIKGRTVEHQVVWRGLFTMAVRNTVIHPNGDRQVKMIEM